MQSTVLPADSCAARLSRATAPRQSQPPGRPAAAALTPGPAPRHPPPLPCRAARELAASENAASSPKSCVALVNAFCKENQGFCDFLSAIFEIKNSNAFCKYLAEVSDGALWNCERRRCGPAQRRTLMDPGADAAPCTDPACVPPRLRAHRAAKPRLRHGCRRQVLQGCCAAGRPGRVREGLPVLRRRRPLSRR